MSVSLVDNDPLPSGSESDAAGSDNPLLGQADKWDTEVKESKKFFRKKVDFRRKKFCLIVNFLICTRKC